ncbi:MAG: hypothetical protein AAGH88_16435, partial [Planctomycetota bacterium]
SIDARRLATSVAELGFDRLNEEAVELLAALPAGGGRRPDAFAPLPAGFGLGALDHLAADDHEADLLFGA